jgi:hypothetical protein
MGIRTPDLPLASQLAELVGNEDQGGGSMRTARLTTQHHVVAASAVAVSHTGDTNETALATVAVPAGLMGTTGVLRVTSLWSLTSSENAKVLRARLGGMSGTEFLAVQLTSSATYRDQRQIANRNSASSQVGGPAGNSLLPLESFGPGGGWGAAAAAVVTAAIDTTVNQNLVLTGQLADAGETVALEAYLVELLRKS